MKRDKAVRPPRSQGQVYNFQRRFKAKILARIKRHTIRAHRKRPQKVGAPMHLYTGLRLKPTADGVSQTELLGRFPCVKIQEIEINLDRIFIDGVELTAAEKELLAYHDGFDSLEEMLTFWQGRIMPWRGQILHWDPERPVNMSEWPEDLRVREFPA